MGLFHEPAVEDIGEFQVMFRMSADSFDGPSRQFSRQTARPDIDRQRMTLLFHVKQSGATHGRMSAIAISP